MSSCPNREIDGGGNASSSRVRYIWEWGAVRWNVALRQDHRGLEHFAGDRCQFYRVSNAISNVQFLYTEYLGVRVLERDDL